MRSATRMLLAGAALSVAFAYDEVADIKVIKLNTKDTTATGPCHFFRSKDHLAYLRLGNDAMVGDTKATYDAAKKTITSVAGAPFEKLRLAIDGDGDEIQLFATDDETKGWCAYDVTVREGTVLGIQGEPRYRGRTVIEAGVVKVGALDAARSTKGNACLTAAPTTTTRAGTDEAALYSGQEIAFARFTSEEKGETQVVFGRKESDLDEGELDVGDEPFLLFKEGPTLAVATADKDDKPSGCVFAATVSAGKVFGVEAAAPNKKA